MSPVVDTADRAPLILNGGLEKINPFFWVAYLVDVSAIDVYKSSKSKSDNESFFPENLRFDPLDIYPKTEVGQQRNQFSEFKNRRFVIIPIVRFTTQEFVFKSEVTDQSLLFF